MLPWIMGRPLSSFIRHQAYSSPMPLGVSSIRIRIRILVSRLFYAYYVRTWGWRGASMFMSSVWFPIQPTQAA